MDTRKSAASGSLRPRRSADRLGCLDGLAGATPPNRTDLVRQCVGELGVPNRAGCLLDLSRDRIAALGANARGPARVGAHADLALPLWRYLREEVREDVRRAGAFRPVNDHDVGIGECDAFVRFRDRRVVPLRDFPEEDICQDRARELQFGIDSGDVVDRHDPPRTVGKWRSFPFAACN